MNKFCILYLVVILLAMLGIGSMDFQDQLKQQDLYCEMVSSGAWGDYHGNFKDVCPDERANDAAQEKGSSDQ
jgi:hypothetical protein